MMKVPSPEPQTAMPVAKARFFSKYMDTLTMAGRYIRPKPSPKNMQKIIFEARRNINKI